MEKNITEYMRELGRKGGQSKSAKKINAARKNILLALEKNKQQKALDSGKGIDPKSSDLNQPESSK